MNRPAGHILWQEPTEGALQIDPQAVHVWRLPLSEHRAGLASMFESLDQNERRRVDALRFEHLRERYILRHGLLRLVLAAYLDQSPKEIQLEAGAAGKPYICDKSLPNIEFNLSDCDDVAIVGVTREHSIGVDVERVRSDRPAVEIIPEFAPDERDALNSAESILQRNQLLYLIWVRKEAYLKAQGLGLGISLKSFSVPLSHPIPESTWNIPTLTQLPSSMCCGFDFSVDVDLLGAVVVCGLIGPLRFYGASPGWALKANRWYDEIST